MCLITTHDINFRLARQPGEITIDPLTWLTIV
jgi:hypothetical protein